MNANNVSNEIVNIQELDNSPDPTQIKLLTAHTNNPDRDSVAMPELTSNDTPDPEAEPKDPELPYETLPDSEDNNVVETPSPATDFLNNVKAYESLDSDYEFFEPKQEFNNVGNQSSNLAIAPTNLIIKCSPLS